MWSTSEGWHRALTGRISPRLTESHDDYGPFTRQLHGILWEGVLLQLACACDEIQGERSMSKSHDLPSAYGPPYVGICGILGSP